jgi:hypothetical protein
LPYRNGKGKGGHNRERTHCLRGHAYTPNNTRYLKSCPNTRQCRTCDYLRALACQDKRKVELVAAYGGKCSWPGCTVCDQDMLNLDHINDDGKDDRDNAARTTGYNFYIKIKRAGFPKDRFQLLCANHNLKKEILRRKALRAAHLQRLSEGSN